MTRPAALALLGLVACGGTRGEQAAPENLPLPAASLSGGPVAVYPITMVVAASELGWGSYLEPRAEALAHADSLIADVLTVRNPEVEWVLPAELRRAARRAPGMLADPDRMATALLRAQTLNRLPDPLYSQMRNLNGVAAGRMALVPAAVLFAPAADGTPRAELALVIADVRTGEVRWRSHATGTGGDPWEALSAALRSLNPDLP